MLLILPILTLVIYIFTIIKLLKKKDEHTSMHIFLVTTPLIISLINTTIIYHFHLFNISNPLMFTLVVLLCVLASVLKGISFIKDSDLAIQKSPLYDFLSIISLVIVLVFFR